MPYKLELEEVRPSVSRLRSVTSQLIACMSPNLLLLDLGMTISFATIAVPTLLNAPEGLSLNDYQASWFGSMNFLTQPAGALLSGPIVDYCGRKYANFLVNIPHLISWILMYFAWDVPSLFVACGLLGLGNGVMEAPINSYVGEVSEASIRGALCTVTQFYTAIGVFAMYYLGVVLDWRTISLICLVAPVCSMLLVLLVPESPVWLLSRGREKEAMKSLCYLRGWTTTENVREEFDQLSEYSKTLQQCVICAKSDEKEQPDCPHRDMKWSQRMVLKFRYVMLSKETMRPLSLVVFYFLFHVMSGLGPIRPNMVNVCNALGMAVDGKNVVSMVGVITLVTSFLVIMLVKVLGKRKLAIGAMAGTAISCTAISVYAKNYLDEKVFSYDVTTFPTEKSYVPLVLFYLMIVFTGFGIPWVLLGEVFPFRSRATAQGLAAAANYLITFMGSKTFINLERNIGLYGAFAVFAAFGFLGALHLYFFLPETEGKSLHEIESYYSGKLRTFADDPVINNIKKISNCCKSPSTSTTNM